MQMMPVKKVWIFLAIISTFHGSMIDTSNINIPSRKSRSIIFPKESPETPEEEGQQSCVTPRGRSGHCVIVTSCQLLWNHRRNYSLLRRLNCGYEGEVPKVCCPVCTTSSTQPNATTATPSSVVTRPSLPQSGRRPLVGIPSLLLDEQSGRRGQAALLSGGSETKRPPAGNSRDLIKSYKNKSAVAPTGRSHDEIISLLPKECGKNDVPLRRIVGGHESVIGAWPWLAALYLTRRGIKTAECGGALVTAKHVITAAHCTVNSRRGTTFDASQITIRLGDHDLESDEDGLTPVEVQVSNIIKHRNFVLRTFQNDIAILELVSSVKFQKYIAPLCLPYGVFQGDNLAGRNAFVAGWGTTSFDGPASSKLLEVQLRIWQNSDCADVFRRDVPITSVNLCAGDGDKDACRGDSGGPLMLPHTDGRFYMVGIVSFGKKCAEPGIPGVYTRTTAFLDWIADNIKST